ncbi:hypothetical protein EZS27_015247 [termite gut metagenome]|uniref:Uncharacterized protein n=1 Tax=termite gut metagenome TaxID=433724 RepID=A0A5J4RRJ4_9ZZZZ
MSEYEEIREALDIYLMEQFRYHLSLVYLTPNNIPNHSKKQPNRPLFAYQAKRKTVPT